MGMILWGVVAILYLMGAAIAGWVFFEEDRYTLKTAIILGLFWPLWVTWYGITVTLMLLKETIEERD